MGHKPGRKGFQEVDEQEQARGHWCLDECSFGPVKAAECRTMVLLEVVMDQMGKEFSHKDLLQDFSTQGWLRNGTEAVVVAW